VRIDALLPSAGPPGSEIVVVGSGFSLEENLVTFGPSAGLSRTDGSPGNLIARVASAGGRELRFVLPESGASGVLCDTSGSCITVAAAPLDAGSYDVTVSNAQGASNSLAFELTTVGAALAIDDPNGLPCGRVESLLFHMHAHLAIYVDGETREVPYGIGIGEPWELIETSDGSPFVSRGSCYSWLHTHALDGIIHIEAPIPRSFTLGDFFAVWGQPLSSSEVADAEGQVFAYLDGEPVEDARDIPLYDRGVIQLNVGLDLPPPQPYALPSRYD
jgi:hypothetical protein